MLWAGSNSWGLQAVSLGLHQPCSSPSGTQQTFQGISQDNSLCLPPPRCSSLFPLSFSPAPPSPSLSFLSHSRAQPFLCQVHHPTTSPYPSAHPWGISLLTTLPASLPSTQGSPVLLPWARAPGTAPNCSSQVTDWHFWGESDLCNTRGQEGATDGFGNPTTPCSNGCDTEDFSVTPGITWELGRCPTRPVHSHNRGTQQVCSSLKTG